MLAFLNTKTGRGIVLALGLLGVMALGYWAVIALIILVAAACMLEALSFQAMRIVSNRTYVALFVHMWIVWMGAYSAARILSDHSIWTIMVIVATVYVENASAQIFGKRFGRTKLFPRYSPNKTVAGAIWGWAFGLVAGVATLGLAWQFGGLGNQIMANWKQWLVILIITPPFAEIGDWLESRLKRLSGVKDSGEFVAASPSRVIRIIGLSAVFGRQGGALDKTDSLWFVMSAAYVILLTSWQIGLALALGVVAAIVYIRTTMTVHHR